MTRHVFFWDDKTLPKPSSSSNTKPSRLITTEETAWGLGLEGLWLQDIGLGEHAVVGLQLDEMSNVWRYILWCQGKCLGTVDILDQVSSSPKRRCCICLGTTYRSILPYLSFMMYSLLSLLACLVVESPILTLFPVCALLHSKLVR